MVNHWEPGTFYGEGSVVEYQGHRYKVIQPHTAQGDWTPPATPALWGRLEDSDSGNQCQPQQGQQQYQQPQQQYQPPQQQPYNPPQPAQPPSYGGGKLHPDQTVEIGHEEQKKHWYDIPDDRKKELEIGGGLLAGVAAIGAGYFAYKEHEKSGEEKKAQTWALQNWLDDAKNRTAAFNQNGARGPATWILTEGKHIPQGAIVVGKEHTWTLYICRAFHDGGIQVGKASDAFKKGAVIGYKQEEIHLGTYEVLVGDMRGLKWIDVHGKLHVATLGHTPVDGGREPDGTLLYVVRAPYKDVVHPGKTSEKLDGAYIPYDGTEKKITDYQVLCYA